MRILIHLPLAASAVVDFNQRPQDSPVKMTPELIPEYRRALKDDRILQGKASAASPNMRRLATDNWLTNCINALCNLAQQAAGRPNLLTQRTASTQVATVTHTAHRLRQEARPAQRA
ncbi:hypothetical protein AeRB84_009481 [Aphanomyces euteiches]|nr:hypothetical protein AeRB84_009481 [Aphanomyces euteiches]